MVRRALTYQLILAVAVGPLLCCCSAGKASAASPATAERVAPVPPPAARTAHACCSHKETPAKADERKPAPSKPGQPTGKCPCKDGGNPQVTQAELAQTDLATFLRA